MQASWLWGFDQFISDITTTKEGSLIGEDECRYCGGNCPNDEAHACDGYLGDIDNLYKEDL